MKWSIRRRMILLLIPAIILVLTVATLISLQLSSTAQTAAAYDTNRNLAHAYADEFNTGMSDYMGKSRRFALVLDQNTGMTRQDVLTIQHSMLGDNPRAIGIGVIFEPGTFDGQDARYASTPGFDTTGRFATYWNRLNGTESLIPVVDIETSDWYTIPKQTGNAIVMEPQPYEHVLMTSYITPIIRNHTFTGTVGIDVPLDDLDRTVSQVKVLDTGYAFLVSNAGIFVSCPEKQYIGTMSLTELSRQKNNTELAAMAADIREGKEGYSEMADPFTGKNVVMFYSPIRTGNWSMVVVAPADEMLAGVMQMGRIMLLIGILSIVLVGGIIILVARSLSEPIVAMSVTADRLASGDLDARVPDQDGELGILAGAFNNMAARLRELISRLEEKVAELQRTQAALQDSEEKYRTILTDIQDAFYRSDRDGKLIMASPSFAHLLGYDSADECTGNRPGIFYRNPAEWDAFHETVYRQGSMKDYEIELVKKDGSPLFVSANGHLYYDKGGKIAGIEGTFHDITERRTAKQQLLRKNDELHEAYAHLARTEEEMRVNFNELSESQKALGQARRKLSLLNAVTFNEIQNQIFSLSAYQHLVKERVTESLAKEYIGKEEEITRKIALSLKFARSYQDLGLRPPRWQDVNMVFHMAISHLEFQDMKHTVLLDGLEIFADPLLEQVFQILADNTLTHGKTATEVKLWYEEGHTSLTLYYEDNGVGIPERAEKTIFSPDLQKEKAGGLFLAREILEITGIAITETGEPGNGIRFEMLVPKGNYRVRSEDQGTL